MKIIFTVLIALATIFAAYAQTGEITGRIFDEKGMPLRGAFVSVMNHGAYTRKEAICDHDGRYTLEYLPFGKYDLRFSYLGYESQNLKAVAVSKMEEILDSVKLKPRTNPPDDTVTVGTFGPEEGGKINIKSTRDRTTPPVQLTKMPGNTLWGFILYAAAKDSTVISDYLKLLRNLGYKKKCLAPGNYKAFVIDKNHKWVQGSSHGWLYEIGFVFDNKNGFEELKQLTRNFILKKGGDKVDILLYTDKGEWFSEVF